MLIVVCLIDVHCTMHIMGAIRPVAKWPNKQNKALICKLTIKNCISSISELPMLLLSKYLFVFLFTFFFQKQRL